MKDDKKFYDTENYIDGSGAKKFNPQVPQRQEEYEKIKKPLKNPKKDNNISPKIQTMDKLSLIVMVMGICICGYLLMQYIGDKSNNTMLSKNIAKLESQLMDLREENDLLEESIDSSVDLDYVYKVATEELGMVWADNSQIIKYDSEESGSVIQYKDVPNANKSVLDELKK